VLRFTELLTSRPGNIDQVDLDELGRHLSQEQIVELVLVIATANWTNRVNDGLRTRRCEDIPALTEGVPSGSPGLTNPVAGHDERVVQLPPYSSTPEHLPTLANLERCCSYRFSIRLQHRESKLRSRPQRPGISWRRELVRWLKGTKTRDRSRRSPPVLVDEASEQIAAADSPDVRYPATWPGPIAWPGQGPMGPPPLRVLDVHAEHTLEVPTVLVDVRRNGRQRRVRLSGPEVARALEGLAAIAAPSTDVHSLSEATARDQLAAGRTCYDHLAGRLGVAVTEGLVRRGAVVAQGSAFVISDVARDVLGSIESMSKRSLAAGGRQCSVASTGPKASARSGRPRRGRLRAAAAAGAIRRRRGTRAVVLTELGAAFLAEHLGVNA
jgi:hypothetical protein